MSNRIMSQEMFDALGATVVTPVFLLEGDFPSGPVRLWTGVGTLTLGRQDLARWRHAAGGRADR